MWTCCNRKLAKTHKSEAKILFSINKLSHFAHHEDVRTDSNSKERGFAMAKAAVKAKAKAKKKTAKKPAAKKRKARR